MHSALKYLTVLAIFLMANTVFAQTISYEKIVNHPRIIFDKGTIKNYTSKVQNDSITAMLHDDVILEANNIIPRGVNKRTFNGKKLTTAGSNFQRISTLSYAYLATGTKRFAQRAISEMVEAAKMSDWNPENFTDVADMTIAISLGYDWLYDVMDSQTRELLASSIIEKGLKPSLSSDYSSSWFDNGGSENQICNAGMIIGALAVYETDAELSKKIIERSLESVKKSLALYSTEGAYPEGYGGWVIGTSYTAMMLEALETSYGKNFKMPKELTRSLFRSGEYSIQIITPRLYSFSYGDIATHAEINFASIWLFDKTSDYSMLFSSARSLPRDKDKDYRKNRMLPLCVLMATKSAVWFSEAKPPVDLVTYIAHGETPVAIFRSHWDSYKKSLYLGLKGGSPSVPHNHQDVGSFCFEARGIRWSFDLGSDNEVLMERQGVDMSDYSQESKRWSFKRYGLDAHSTLIFNGEPQNVNGKADIVDFEEVDNRRTAVTDLTSLYPGLSKVERAVSIVGKSYVVIQDKITVGGSPVSMRWNMLSMATHMEIINSTNALLTRSNESLYMSVFSNTPITFKTWSAVPANSFENQNNSVQCVGFEAELSANTTYTFEVYLMPDKKLNLSQKKFYSFN